VNNSDEYQLSKGQRIFAIISVVLAAESLFLLPYVVPRVFRPTILEVFQVDNFTWNSYVSIYGTVAIFAYLFGGPLADRFAPSKLLASALALTALGGLVVYFETDKWIMPYVYAFWGIANIFLGWAALFKTIRILSGRFQALGFGFLEGGRGLVSVLVSTAAVFVFSLFIITELDLIEVTDRLAAYQNIVLFCTLFIFFVALLVFFSLKPLDGIKVFRDNKIEVKHIKELVGMPVVWLQAFIILCGYSAYKVSDYYSQLANDVLGYSEIEAASLANLILWIRPISAIVFGILGDLIKPSKMILFSFVLVIIGCVNLSFEVTEQHLHSLVMITICSTAIAVYALRGLYFSIMDEAYIPLRVTGTAVGLASVIGYLPDIFMGPVQGYIMDSFQGILRYQYLFLLTAAISVLGLICTFFFRRAVKNQNFQNS